MSPEPCRGQTQQNRTRHKVPKVATKVHSVGRKGEGEHEGSIEDRREKSLNINRVVRISCVRSWKGGLKSSGKEESSQRESPDWILNRTLG